MIEQCLILFLAIVLVLDLTELPFGVFDEFGEQRIVCQNSAGSAIFTQRFGGTARLKRGFAGQDVAIEVVERLFLGVDFLQTILGNQQLLSGFLARRRFLQSELEQVDGGGDLVFVEGFLAALQESDGFRFSLAQVRARDFSCASAATRASASLRCTSASSGKSRNASA